MNREEELEIGLNPKTAEKLQNRISAEVLLHEFLGGQALEFTSLLGQDRDEDELMI